MTSKVTYIGDLRTEAVHLSSQHSITTDAPTDNHGMGEKFSPTDLVATALASCMMTIIGIKARTWDKDPKGMAAEVTKIIASDPRRIGEIVIRLSIPVLLYNEKEREILRNAALACPVAKSLHPDLLQNISIIFE